MHDRTNDIFLDPLIKTYKRKFDRDLRHIKIILTHKRQNLPYKEWLELVHETKETIMRSPQEFFCYELPPATIFGEAIEKVFLGFLEDQRIRSVQSSVGAKYPRH